MSEEQNNDFKEQIEREARLLAQQEEATTAAAAKQEVIVEEVMEIPIAEPTVTTLGKAEKFKVYDEDPIANELGWKNVPLENLPSGGSFYEPGTQVAIRAASVAEIRHWSTIDENDLLGVDDMLNYIIDKCARIKVPGKPGTYKDLKEIDRFYLIFAIRDYTFKNGENKMYVTVTNEEGLEEKVEVTKDVIDYFNADERMMNYFNHEERCFDIRMKNGENFKMFLPTLGTMLFIKNYLKQRQQSGTNFDKSFVKYAPFLFQDWKFLTQSIYDKAVQDSYTWSLQKISVMDKLVEILASSVKPQVRYRSMSGLEATAPLNFQSGVKSIFLISDIFGELV
jgi:hypothetical protein